MGAREKEIAENTKKLIENAKTPQTIYYEDGIVENRKERNSEDRQVIRLTMETTNQAMERVCYEGKSMIALNFASAKNPGGGWLSGAVAQEEALCRTSNLSKALDEHTEFYDKSIKDPNFNLYHDDILFSEDVTFFKTDEGQLIYPYKAGIITCACPNKGALRKEMEDEEYEQVLMQRANKIIDVANEHPCDVLILGAWGCGVFRNDPSVIARVLYKAVKRAVANEIVFAIPFSRKSNENMASFAWELQRS